METNTWSGCYPSRWQSTIVPEAIAHPAKFSSRLIRRIYEHMQAENWLAEGNTVIDPFGGVALGALDAMRLGLRWRGVELELKFANLGNQNITLWNSRFSIMPHWSGDALLLHGDSRNLAQVLAGADSCISSPPFLGMTGTASGELEARKGRTDTVGKYADETPGNLGNMKSTAAGLQAAVSSPPYAGSEIAHNDEKGTFGGQGAVARRRAKRSQSDWNGYGATPGQLGAMKANGFKAAVNTDNCRWVGAQGIVSSPPYENAINQHGEGPMGAGDRHGHISPTEIAAKNIGNGYGSSYGNIGNDSGDDFWSAAKTIIEQVYQVLAPGGHAVWVVKAFVKDKQLVDFPAQWRQLCEAVGFVTLHEHRALLVSGTQGKLEGGVHYHESKSFFRRLAEKKGSPRIDFETVYCMEKHNT